MPQPGFIDHIGIGVPDLVAAKEYYDELMSVLGLREWFETVSGGPLNYGPTAREARSCSSTKPKNPAPTHACARAFITSRSWLRAGPSSGRRTGGLVVAMP
jgi:catechol 2,3-dioxygenase-like lactoylglutathione lyase family enzyme